MECIVCGKPIERPKRGPVAKTCTARCRMALSRARRAAREVRAVGSSFPDVMAGARRWVRADGKRPIAVVGYGASSTDPSTWTTFSAVQDGAGDGFGFMLGGGVGCYDLDNALDVDGVLKDWARANIASIPEQIIYTERSVSGRGLHVFVLAPEGRGRRRPAGDGSVERYTTARFIRCGEKVELDM